MAKIIQNVFEKVKYWQALAMDKISSHGFLFSIHFISHMSVPTMIVAIRQNRYALFPDYPWAHSYLTVSHNHSTVKPVCNDHLYVTIYYLWFIQ